MNKYLLYPGCSMEGSAKAYTDSLAAIAGPLGLELEEIHDWNCCGATEYVGISLTPAYALISRNLARDLRVFSVAALGMPPLTYQWRNNGSAIPGATDSSFSIPSVQTAHRGIYSVVIQNAAGSVTSAEAALVVVVPPAIGKWTTSQAVRPAEWHWPVC